MFATIYIIAVFVCGRIFCLPLRSRLLSLTRGNDLFGRRFQIAPLLLLLPAYFVSGALVLTWSVYLMALLFCDYEKPLLFANVGCLIILSVLMFQLRRRGVRIFPRVNILNRLKTLSWDIELLADHSFICLAVAFAYVLMFHSFDANSDALLIGGGAVSDFGSHIPLIRSFSVGNNFPTGYPHFANAGIRYHFMFFFMAGNLEYLGLPIEWALNGPSILAFSSMLMLLYVFAVNVFGSRKVGWLALVLFGFRSSSAAFVYFSSLDFLSIRDVVAAILHSHQYVGTTTGEDWGMWTLHDFVNQRHFSFGISLLILIVLMVLPNFSFGVSRVSRSGDTLLGKIRAAYLGSTAWKLRSLSSAICIGLLVGLGAFWHGSAFLSILLILSVFFIVSDFRLEIISICSLAYVLGMLQSWFFVSRHGGTSIELLSYFGFMAQDQSFYGVLQYLLTAFGLLPILVLVVFFVAPLAIKWLLFAVLSPAIFIFFFRLTTDLMIGHKFVAISIVLINVFVSWLMFLILRVHKIIGTVVFAILLFLLTITGIINCFTLYNVNIPKWVLRSDDRLYQWVLSETSPRAVFLTYQHHINPILQAGRKVFNGYGYFTDGPGYEVGHRSSVSRHVYSERDFGQIKYLLLENFIDYVVIDQASREWFHSDCNEELFRRNLSVVYSDPSLEIVIFAVKKPGRG